MRNKKLLAIILLSLSFCFVSGVGYGAVTGDHKPLDEQSGGLLIDWRLMQQTGTYMMENPTTFLRVWITYDENGGWGRFPSLRVLAS